jgi:Uma2 family endonuclease
MSTKTRLMTADEFLMIPDDGLLHELIRGEVTTMPLPGGRHGKIALEIGRMLGNFVETHALGETYAAETGFLIERDPDTVRGADVAFVRKERLPEIVDPDKHVPFAPDLAVELVSPTDRRVDVLEKIEAWLTPGARMVWVGDPKSPTITVHRQGTEPVTLTVDQTIDGSDVVPGFSCRVADCFD